jgi:anti-sigma regulatory factor (Ser/Thr protein kinase)
MAVSRPGRGRAIFRSAAGGGNTQQAAREPRPQAGSARRTDCVHLRLRHGSGHSPMSDSELLASIELPAVPAAVRSARRWTKGLLAPSCSGDLVDTAVLLVSELVSNAIQACCGAAYASGGPDPGRIELAVARTGARIRLEVADSACRSFPVLARQGADGEGGRGLQVIAMLSRRWGCWAGPGGKVVWCELPGTDQMMGTDQPPTAEVVPGVSLNGAPSHAVTDAFSLAGGEDLQQFASAGPHGNHDGRSKVVTKRDGGGWAPR